MPVHAGVGNTGTSTHWSMCTLVPVHSGPCVHWYQYTVVHVHTGTSTQWSMCTLVPVHTSALVAGRLRVPFLGWCCTPRALRKRTEAVEKGCRWRHTAVIDNFKLHVSKNCFDMKQLYTKVKRLFPASSFIFIGIQSMNTEKMFNKKSRWRPLHAGDPTLKYINLHDSINVHSKSRYI